MRPSSIAALILATAAAGGTLCDTVLAQTPQRLTAEEAIKHVKHRVEPSYPPLALSARIQGVVVVHATVLPSGELSDLEVLRGHPLLQQSAINAVKHWKFEPFLQEGAAIAQPIEIHVPFVLAPSDADLPRWKEFQKYFGLGYSAYRKSDRAAAQQHLEKAASLSQNPPYERLLEVHLVFDMLGQISYVKKDYLAAESLFRHSINVLERRVGPDEAEMASAWVHLGWSLEALKRYTEAEDLYRRGIAIWESRIRATKVEELRSAYSRYLARTYRRLAIVSFYQEKTDDLESMFQSAATYGDKYLESGELKIILRDYAGILRSKGKIGEAAQVEQRLALLP